MIGMLLGLIVTGIAISMYISTLGITRQTGNTVRIGHELSASLDLIVRDLRRAGYWNDSSGSNPHGDIVAGGSPVMIFDAGATTPKVSGDCVVFSYDLNRSGGSTSPELFGYKLAVESSVGVLQGLFVASAASPSGNGCDQTGWVNVTDPSFLNITALSFVANPNGSVASFASASVRSIGIEISGFVIDDPLLVRQVRESVRVRNDL